MAATAAAEAFPTLRSGQGTRSAERTQTHRTGADAYDGPLCRAPAADTPHTAPEASSGPVGPPRDFSTARSSAEGQSDPAPSSPALYGSRNTALPSPNSVTTSSDSLLYTPNTVGAKGSVQLPNHRRQPSSPTGPHHRHKRRSSGPFAPSPTTKNWPQRIDTHQKTAKFFFFPIVLGWSPVGVGLFSLLSPDLRCAIRTLCGTNAPPQNISGNE